MRLLVRRSDLRFRPQKSRVGSALPDLRQRPVFDVSAPFLERSVVRKASDEIVDLCPRTSQSSVCIRMARDFFGGRRSGHCGAVRRWLFLILGISSVGDLSITAPTISYFHTMT